MLLKKSFSFFKYQQKMSQLLIELLIQSGILVESQQSMQNNKNLYTLAIYSNKDFYFYKIDQIILYWRTFFIFILFFFQKAQYKAQFFLKLLRKISFIENFGTITTYFNAQDETIKRFKSFLDDYNILINLPIIIFINSPYTPSFAKLKNTLDKANFLVITLDPYLNYTNSKILYDMFNVIHFKNTILYFLYKSANMHLSVKNLFLNIQRKNTTAVSDQISYSYNPIEKNIIITLSEINTSDDYSLPGNFTSRYSLDFIYFFFNNIITFTIKKKKKQQIFFKKLKKCNYINF